MIYWMFDVVVSFAGVIPALILNRWRPSQRRHLGGIALTAMYLCALLALVGIPSVPYFHWSPNINLIPFVDLQDSRVFQLTILNVLLFVPLGFFVPLCWPEMRKLWRITGLGMNLSLAVEILQMFAGRATDIDDFITNTIGTAVGFLLFRLLMPRKFCHHRAGVASLYILILVCLLYRIFLGQTVYNEAFHWLMA